MSYIYIYLIIIYIIIYIHNSIRPNELMTDASYNLWPVSINLFDDIIAVHVLNVLMVSKKDKNYNQCQA